MGDAVGYQCQECGGYHNNSDDCRIVGYNENVFSAGPCTACMNCGAESDGYRFCYECEGHRAFGTDSGF